MTSESDKTRGDNCADNCDDEWSAATIVNVHNDEPFTLQYNASSTRKHCVQRVSVLHPYDVRVTCKRIYKSSLHAAKTYAGCRFSYTTYKAQMLSAGVLSSFAEFCTSGAAVHLLRQAFSMLHPLPLWLRGKKV